jgi:hypothetical protein
VTFSGDVGGAVGVASVGAGTTGPPATVSVAAAGELEGRGEVPPLGEDGCEEPPPGDVLGPTGSLLPPVPAVPPVPVEVEGVPPPLAEGLGRREVPDPPLPCVAPPVVPGREPALCDGGATWSEAPAPEGVGVEETLGTVEGST